MQLAIIILAISFVTILLFVAYSVLNILGHRKKRLIKYEVIKGFEGLNYLGTSYLLTYEEYFLFGLIKKFHNVNSVLPYGENAQKFYDSINKWIVIN